MEFFSLKNKIALITGGASGIGLAIAHLFAKQGAAVHILDVNAEQAEKAVSNIRASGGQAEAHICNLTEQARVLEVVKAIGDIHILVNNAGIAHIGTAENTTETDFDRIFAINVKGVYNCLHAVIPVMKRLGGGAILNMASIAATLGLADRFAYSMSKGAVVTMTFSVAKDFINDHIRCNCISPARVHTPFVDDFLTKNYPGKEAEVFEKLSKTQPIGRMGQPEEIAYLALYLCSDEAAFITGCDYPIDGGFTKLNTF